MKTYQILIVDDEPDYLDTISEMIEGVDNGYEVLEAQSGPMAYDIARGEHPDLIITDWDMPEMSGIDLITSLKQHEDTCDIPVIMCTGVMTTSKHLETALTAGAVDYIRKPVDSIELTARISSMLTLADSLRQLKSAKEKAEVANRAKSVFLANMSHELRTPLNAILGFAQMMTHNPTLPPEDRDNLAIIQRNGEHLLTLINQVLDFSKIEAGRITLNEKTFDLYRLLGDLNDMFCLEAQQKRLRLSFEYTSDVPRYVCTDEVKLRQVLSNVLSNAMKFTQEGSVALEVTKVTKVTKVENDDPQSSIGNLQFSISDTGAGIAPEEMDQLFEAFVQTKTGRQAQEGTGLGLPISRKFARLMGGDITVTSDVGRGTIVRFDIQATLVEDTDVARTQPIRHVIALGSGQSRYRLLIVDDKPDNRTLFVKLLTPFGFELREATNGQEAVAIWNEWKPHLIWMDLRMPVMGGYEATRHIRRAEEKPTSPLSEGDAPSQEGSQSTIIIALSASSLGEERAVALSKGCNDFLRKPFHEADIFALMHTHLGLRFVYKAGGPCKEETQSSIIDHQSSIQAALAALAAEWLETLKQGARRADFILLASVIAQIREQDARLADALAQLAEDFEYDEILALIQTKEAPEERR